VSGEDREFTELGQIFTGSISTSYSYTQQTPYPAPNYETTEVRSEKWWLEVVIAGGGLRYHMAGERAKQPLFQYLAERRTEDLPTNFKLLVQDMCRFAPGVTINRGTYYLRENNPDALVYPSKKAFNEEMIWLLWQLLGGRPTV